MSNSARRKIVEMHQQLAQLRREKDVLRATIEIARQHPDFDAGGPIAEMLDEALSGKTPHMVEALERLVPLVPYSA